MDTIIQLAVFGLLIMVALWLAYFVIMIAMMVIALPIAGIMALVSKLKENHED